MPKTIETTIPRRTFLYAALTAAASVATGCKEWPSISLQSQERAQAKGMPDIATSSPTKTPDPTRTPAVPTQKPDIKNTDSSADEIRVFADYRKKIEAFISSSLDKKLRVRIDDLTLSNQSIRVKSEETVPVASAFKALVLYWWLTAKTASGTSAQDIQKDLEDKNHPVYHMIISSSDKYTRTTLLDTGALLGVPLESTLSAYNDFVHTQLGLSDATELYHWEGIQPSRDNTQNTVTLDDLVHFYEFLADDSTDREIKHIARELLSIKDPDYTTFAEAAIAKLKTNFPDTEVILSAKNGTLKNPWFYNEGGLVQIKIKQDSKVVTRIFAFGYTGTTWNSCEELMTIAFTYMRDKTLVSQK